VSKAALTVVKKAGLMADQTDLWGYLLAASKAASSVLKMAGLMVGMMVGMMAA
jgi:hypothetical protein